MSFDQFISKWNGRGIDFDGYYGDQCMDLMHQYLSEVLGLTDGRILAAPNAKTVYTNFANVFGHERFERIANTPNGVPQKGDIVFWGNGTAGHVAIYRDGNVYSFTSFDQNYPTGSKCHLQKHDYTGVLGWLRIKQPTAVGDDVLLGKIRNVVNGSTGTPHDRIMQIREILK